MGVSVTGSSPVVLNNFCIAQQVEQQAFNLEVLGSSPGARNLIYIYTLLNFKKMFFKLNNFMGIYPEILLILSVLFLIGYLVIYEFFFHYKIIFINLGGFLAMLSLFLILILIKNNLNLDFQLFQSLVVSDFLSMNAKFILCLFCILLFSVSFSYLKRDLINNYEYFLISLLAVLGILIITSAYDLMTIYLAVELQSLCFYVLATFKPHNNFSTEAGIKYFILGAFSSGLLLLGMSLLYGYTGLTDFYSFSLFFQQNNE